LTRIIGVLNFKGGTGKTTTVVNLAAGLAQHGQRVLCVDLDAQGSVAAYFGAKYNYSLYHLIVWNVPAIQCVHKVRPNLEILAGDNSILDVQGHLWRMNNDEAAQAVLQERLAALNDYDYILLDFSPSASILSENGLLYMRELFVPVSLNHMSVMGFIQVSKTLREISRTPDHQIRLSLIIPTFYNMRRRKDREILESLQRRFPQYITDPIRENVKLAEAPGQQKTIFEYAPASNGAEDYRKLVERVIDQASSTHL
jgi:chromosome partitioning protein